MNSGRARRVILRIISILMLLCALPMLIMCFTMLGSAQTNYHDGVTSPEPPYAAAGCFAMAIVYVFSMVTAIAGLSFASKQHRWGWCRVLAYIQLGAGLLLIFPMEEYALLTLPPLLILTIPLLFCVGWSNKRKGGRGDGEAGEEEKKQ